jgi:FAD/FMN-containing dehydrogenase
MNKVAHYLQEHVIGEVMTGVDARRYFATDSSIFTLAPAIVVYPRNENDVRKTARFAWQLAERGRIIPITARGAGTDQTGAALGQGIMLVFPAHLHRILEFDPKSGTATVEPGINYGKLQQTLNTHHRFLPPYPASLEYSTIGGAVANNAGGEKSLKYGTTRDFVKSLRVVLANGEVIETKRLTKRELNRKLGLATFEGEIYRSLETLIDENKEVIAKTNWDVTKNATGYALQDVKRKDGSFDLTPLLVGSQGTLAIATEITLNTEPNSPNTTLIAARFDDLKSVQEVINELRKMTDMPSAIEMVDQALLNFVREQNPNQLKGVFEAPFPKVVLLIEFDNVNERTQKRLVHKALKILAKHQIPYIKERDAVKRDELWKVRDSAATLLSHTETSARALPFIEDAVVPVERFAEFLKATYELLAKYDFPPAIWGHAGDGNVHITPLLDLAQVGDRQRIFKLMDDYYELVLKLGGSTSGQNNDGRLRGPLLEKFYGAEVYELFKKVKAIFDPYGILNPGVKTGASFESNKPLIRQEYTLSHFYDHMPRS